MQSSLQATPPTVLPGKNIPQRQGFTLIELLVVLAIVASLITLVAPRYFHQTDRAREAVLRENLKTTRQAIDSFFGDKGRYPKNLAELVDARYLKNPPFDPVTESASTWILVHTEGGDNSGVTDIRSGAQGTGIDNTRYRDW